MSANLVFLIILLLGGLAVWGEIVRRKIRGLPLLPTVPQDRPRWNPIAVVVAGLLVAFYLGTRLYREWQLLTDAGPESTAATLSGVQSGLLQNVLLCALLVSLLSWLGRESVVPFGIRRDRWVGDLKAGSLGFLAAMPGVFAVMWLTSPLRGDERTHGMVQLLQNGPSMETYLWVVLSVVIAAPLLEELLFRVILQGALRTKLKSVPAICISSVAFAFVHGFPDSLALLPLAFVLGYVFEQRRSYLSVVVLHALFNTRTLVILLLS